MIVLCDYIIFMLRRGSQRGEYGERSLPGGDERTPEDAHGRLQPVAGSRLEVRQRHSGGLRQKTLTVRRGLPVPMPGVRFYSF